MFLPHDKGQGLVEYVLIRVLVVIVLIAILLLVGPRIAIIFGQLTTRCQGSSHLSAGFSLEGIAEIAL